MTKKNPDVDAFEVPTLESLQVVDLELLDPAKAAEEAEKLQKAIPRLKEKTVINLSWLEGMARQNQLARELAEALIKKQKEKAAKKGQELLHPREWLQKHLNHEFGPFRRAVWSAKLEFFFSKEVSSREEAEKLMENLCQDGSLRENEEGSLEIFGKHYSISEEAKLDEQEVSRLAAILSNLGRKAERAERYSRMSRWNALLEKGNLSTADLFQGKPGLYSVLTSENGSRKPQGALVVKSDGKGVAPLQSDGDFQKDMEELKRTGKSLLLHVLNWDTISPDFFTQRARFGEQEAKLMEKFWQLLKTGIEHKKRREQLQSLREDYDKRATITPEEFLLEGKIGICRLEHEGPWEWHNPGGNPPERLRNVFFLIERREGKEAPLVGLVDYPPWLKQFFADSQDFYPEGEKFEGLPLNLAKVLRSIWGQVKKNQQIQQMQTTRS